MYNIGSPTTMLVKNIGSSWFGEQQLVINYVTIFVFHVHDATIVKKVDKNPQQEDIYRVKIL
jgi:hypothetical protein